MEIIKYLGNILAQKINVSPPAARGLLKLSIKDELGPFKQLSQVNYNDLKLVIENAMKKRLINLDIQNTDSLISFMLDELTNHQSLITMAGV